MPNFGKKKKRRCVRMVKTKHYKWRMASCSAKYRFICEKGEYLASAALRVNTGNDNLVSGVYSQKNFVGGVARFPKLFPY